ncbi:MAG: hypothetical protein KAJ66_00320 [Candidatus Omnitrophica bacterium]|nr:hypothetical protein [Candidatus Omnitrophota bacterium]
MGKMTKITIYIIGALLVGFLLSFYYQTIVDSNIDPFSIKYSFFSVGGNKQDSFLLLKGWQSRKVGNDYYSSMKGERALLIVDVPSKNGVCFEFKYRTSDPDQVIQVYCKQKMVGILKGGRNKNWEYGYITVNSSLIDIGLNKVHLIKSKASEPDFADLTISNYKNKKLIFMRAYVVWESTKWFNKRGDISVNWNRCFYTALSFLCAWLIYSGFFWLFTKKGYLFIAYMDLYSYLPAIIYFSILFVISKIISSYTFFYYKIDFILAFVFLTSIGKIYQIIHYGKKDMLVSRYHQFRSFLKNKYDAIGNIFIVIYILTMITCAILLMFDNRVIAEMFCDYGFFVLIAGVALKVIKFFRSKEYLVEDKN